MPPTSGSDREVTCQRVPASGFCGAASVTFKDCCWVTRWQAGLVHFQLLFAMDLDRCFLGALPVRLGFVGLDVGFALLAFQAVDLVPQLLNLCLCVPQVALTASIRFSNRSISCRAFSSWMLLRSTGSNISNIATPFYMPIVKMANSRLFESFPGFPPDY
jgi:hypothetical protein